MTTHALDPAQPGAGGTYNGRVAVTLSATDPLETGGGTPETHDVDAQPSSWDPSTLQAATGDVVRWNFPQTAAAPHDVWVIEPGEAPNSDGRQVTSGLKFPGDPPVSETLDEAGTWTWVCKVHSQREATGWTGMVGTAQVSGGGTAGSGVDFTEYRVNGGDWERSENTEGRNPFETVIAVDEVGHYELEYRSTDEAGNEEAPKSVAFSIAPPANRPPTVTLGADRRSGTAPLPHAYLQAGTYTATVTVTDPGGLRATESVQITVTGTSGSPPPRGEDPPAVSVRAPKRMTARRAIRRGVRLRVFCEETCRARTVLRLSGERVGKSKRLRIRPGSTRTLVARLDRDVRRRLLAAMRQAGLRRVTLTAVTTVITADGARAYPVKITLRR